MLCESNFRKRRGQYEALSFELFLFLLIPEIVDTVLEEDDLDDDGYLTYPEYVFARKREEAREKSEKLREQREKEKKRN